MIVQELIDELQRRCSPFSVIRFICSTEVECVRSGRLVDVVDEFENPKILVRGDHESIIIQLVKVE